MYTKIKDKLELISGKENLSVIYENNENLKLDLFINIIYCRKSLKINNQEIFFKYGN